MSDARLAPMNAEERERRNLCVSLGCVACRKFNGLRGPAFQTVEYHHFIVAGERAGHSCGCALCQWHHQGILQEGATQEAMRKDFGPSMKLESKAFHETFGSDQELLDYQNSLIDAQRAFLPKRRRSRGSTATPSKVFPRDPERLA